MSDALERLNAALADRYKIGSELGQGGMGPQIFADETQMMLDD